MESLTFETMQNNLLILKNIDEVVGETFEKSNFSIDVYEKHINSTPYVTFITEPIVCR